MSHEQKTQSGLPSHEGALIRFIDRFMPESVRSAAEDKKRQVRSALGFLMASWLMAAMFSVANFRQGLLVAAWSEVTAVVILSAMLPLIRRTGRYELFGNIGMSTGLVSIFFACWYADGLEGPALLLVPLVPAYAYLGYGKRSATLWSWLSVAMVVGLFISEKRGWVPPPASTLEKIQTKRFIEAALGVGFGYLAAHVFNQIKDYALAMLELRTQELQDANAHLEQLFHNMRQGVLAFDASGAVVGSASAQALRIFGHTTLAGKSISEVLFGTDASLASERDAFEAWRALVFDAGANDWKELAACAPDKLVRGAGTEGEQHLLLEFRPIVDPRGKLTRVMLMATDESARVRLENQARERDAAHAREVDELRRMVASGAHLVLQFLDVSEQRLGEASTLIGSASRPGDVAVAFAHVHTVRGEARTFQLHELESVCGELENRLSPLRKVDTGTEAFRREATTLLSGLARAKELLQAARARIVELSPVGEVVLDQVTVRRSLLDKVVELSRGTDGLRADELKQATELLAARPFGESTQQLAQTVPLWARQLGRSVSLEITGRELPVPHALGRVLSGVLTHLTRNAIAHGIESPAERERMGKQRGGHLRIACELADNGPRISVEDDGRGLDQEAVQRAARGLGLEANARSAAELIFEPGLSTAPDANDIAGRGMGMAAVRGDLASADYGIVVHSEPGRGTRFEILPRRAANLGKGPDNDQRRRSQVA